MPDLDRWTMVALGVLLAACAGSRPAPRVASPAASPAPPAPRVEAAAPEPAPPAAPRPDCSTALVGLRDLGEVRALVERERCNGHAFDGRRSALMDAVEHGRVEIVAYLLGAGADANFELPGPGRFVGTAEVGKTALWFAAVDGRADLVTLLLSAGADPNRYPPDGVPLLLLASLADSVEVARLLVEAGIDVTQQTSRGGTLMTFGNGPSARMFAYLTSVGVPSDGLPPEVIASLRWEAQRQPPSGASTAEQVAFSSEVVQRTRSARSRELAVKRLAALGPDARAAVPALIGVLRGRELSPTDWSQVYASHALQAIGWTSELDRALPQLLALIPGAPTQTRIALVDMLAANGPASRPVVDAFVRLLRGGPDQALGARGLGVLLGRAAAAGPSLRAAVTALERASRDPGDPHLRSTAQEALQLIAQRGRK